MSFKLLTLFATLAIVSQHLSLVSACKCRVLADPGYCRTEFVAVVKVTGVVDDEISHRKRYTYEIVSDLTTGARANTLKTFHDIETNRDSAACGVYLENGKTYLLGGSFAETTKQPTLNSCSAYWRLWEFSGAKSTEQIEVIRNECVAFHKANPIA